MALTALNPWVRKPATVGSTLPYDGVPEFSRNEPGKQVVSLYVQPTPQGGGEAGEEITVKLYKARRGRTEEVTQAETTYTFTGAEGAAGAKFDFDLRTLLHSAEYPFPVMRRGNYFFTVTHTGGTTGPSAVTGSTEDFRVAIYTVDRFEKEWLQGATRRSNDDRAVRFQPKKLTGVRVIEVSKNHPLDLLPLSLVKGAETPDPNWYLSWNRGEIVPIDTNVPSGIDQQYILPDRQRKHYVVVQVDPLTLLAEEETESLMIDRSLIDRQTLRDFIDQEADWLEQSFLYTPIEPALVVSDRNLSTLDPSPGGVPAPVLPDDNEDYDILTYPLTYSPPNAGHWIDMELPQGYPIKWEYLEGVLERQRIISCNVGWIHQASHRLIQLVPFNQSSGYHFLGFYYMGSLRGPADLPSFWRYRYYAGIQDEETPREVLDVIAMRAGVKALTLLGQMFRGGFSSQSVSRDGISESVSYTASASYGIYSATIENCNKRLKVLEPQLKRKYMGLYLSVV